MKWDSIDPDRGPTPEQLGAYADGELSAADCAAVDAWLHHHPAHADMVDALRRVTQLWRDTAPLLPDYAAWSAVRAGIEKGLHPQPARPTAPSRLKSRFVLAVVAAAVLAVVFLSKGHWSETVAAEEPYPVVEAQDVVIMSIGGDDCACLIGAQPPVGRIDERDLARADDVLVLNLEEHEDRSVAEQRSEAGAPMLFTPPAGWEHQP